MVSKRAKENAKRVLAGLAAVAAIVAAYNSGSKKRRSEVAHVMEHNEIEKMLSDLRKELQDLEQTLKQ